MRSILCVLSLMIVSGCGGTSPIDYEPAPMSVTESVNTIDRLIMTQHKKWRPDYVDVSGQYLLLGHGVRSVGIGTAVVFQGVAFGSGTSTTREISERLYYEQVHGIVLMSWQRKFKQWYAVSIRDSDEEHTGYIFRTRNLEDAQHFVDALEAVVADYTSDPEQGVARPQPRGNVADELIKLDDLRKRGALTDVEFEVEKKKLLEAD